MADVPFIASANPFGAFVLCTAGVGAAFGLMIYAFAVGHFAIQVASAVAMLGIGAAACRAARPVHVALGIAERRTGS